MPTARSTPYRVLLIDRSAALAGQAKGLFANPDLAPSGEGCRYEHAVEAVRAQVPDVVLVAFSDPVFDGLRAVEEVIAELPVPLVVLHSSRSGKPEAMAALGLGALDLVERPEAPGAAFWLELSRRLTLVAGVRVVQHKRPRTPSPRPRSPGQAFSEPPAAPFPVVAIAASLGGPKALSVLLAALPVNLPAPVLICQHLVDGFSAGLVHWLGSLTPLRVEEAADGATLTPGTVVVAPSGAHLRVDASARIILDAGAPIAGFRPSCNALLTSVALAFRTRAIGVVLTGMGKDGAEGLKEIRTRGGRTIAQDRSSCVVFGMPCAAIALGAAEQVLALDQIAPRLVQWVHEC